MNLDKSHVVVALVSAAAVAGIQFLSFGATYGRLTSSVEQLEKRVSKLEQKAMPGTKLGDLCLKLIEEQAASDSLSNSGTPEQERIEKQLTRLGCYDNVPANATIPAEDADLPINSAQ